MPDSKRQYASYTARRRRSYDDDQENREPSRITTALVTGGVVGILCAALNVTLTFLSVPIFHAAANEGKAVTGNSYALFALGCVSFFTPLLASFIAGFIIGKVAVVRRLGFYAGIVTAAIVYLVGIGARYIPNYPGNPTDNTPVNGATVAGGIVTVVAFLIIWCLIGGLLGLWGARVATRNHPAYVSGSDE
jgi:hypothetical protein